MTESTSSFQYSNPPRARSVSRFFCSALSWRHVRSLGILFAGLLRYTTCPMERLTERPLERGLPTGGSLRGSLLPSGVPRGQCQCCETRIN
jgi:hypothetical protein